MDKARIGIRGSHLGSSSIVFAINVENRNKISMEPRESAPEASSAKRRKRFGEKGSRIWYSAINFESAVLSPETVMAKNMVEIGKIS